MDLKTNQDKIDTLVLTGGGMRDVSIIGVLNVLEKINILNNINKYAGSSSGAMICVLLNIGYTPLEIQNTVFSQGTKIIYDNFLKIPFNLLFNYGLFSGSKIVEYLKILFTRKSLSPNITFIELYEKTKKTLVLTGTSLTQKKTFYFNYHTFPDMKVIDALRISVSIPLYFTSIKYTIDNIQHIFVDGGLLNNFPLYYFEILDEEHKYIHESKLLSEKCQECNASVPENIIGVMIINPGEMSNEPIVINNIKDYISSFINTILQKIQTDNLKNPVLDNSESFLSRVISIYLPQDISPILFDMPQDIFNKLIETGEKSTENFFREKKTIVSSIQSYINWF